MMVLTFLIVLVSFAGTQGQGLNNVGGSYCFDENGKDHAVGEQFSPDNCNTCTCTEAHGQPTPTCTKMYCGNPTIRNPEEEANKCIDNKGKIHEVGHQYTHVDGCNSCVCKSFGGMCTKMFCLPFNKNKKCYDNQGKERTEEDKWTEEGCKQCLCGPFGAVCTECVSNPERIKAGKSDTVDESGDEPCKDYNGIPKMPGDQWLSADNCNICVCLGSSGMSVCTKMACVTRLAKLKSMSGSVVPGGNSGAGTTQISATIATIGAATLLKIIF